MTGKGRQAVWFVVRFGVMDVVVMDVVVREWDRRIGIVVRRGNWRAFK